MRNKVIVRRFIDEVFVKGNVDAVDKLVAHDFVPHSWPSVAPGTESLQARRSNGCPPDSPGVSMKIRGHDLPRTTRWPFVSPRVPRTRAISWAFRDGEVMHDLRKHTSFTYATEKSQSTGVTLTCWA